MYFSVVNSNLTFLFRLSNSHKFEELDMKRVFVTVGTTKFPKLVDTITTVDIIQTLTELGYDQIQIQTGPGFRQVNLPPETSKNALVTQEDHVWTVFFKQFGVCVKYNEYFEDFENEIKKADLIISHAGAGSCLDVLRLNKPLIVVVNEDLMNNHQTELASQLEKNGYLYFCYCKTLKDTLRKNFNLLIPYPKPQDHLFSSYLDKICGFV